MSEGTPMEFNYDSTLSKNEVAERLTSDMQNQGFTVVETDFERPWGGVVKIADSQAPLFLEKYFPGVSLPPTTEGATLSPKILVVEPEKRLSWQVHDRRGEFWKVVDGPVGAFLSGTDEQPDQPQVFENGQTIDIPQGTRHRLVGLDSRGMVAEIWIHTNPENPSNEEDIIRISDDFKR